MAGMSITPLVASPLGGFSDDGGRSASGGAPPQRGLSKQSSTGAQDSVSFSPEALKAQKQEGLSGQGKLDPQQEAQVQKLKQIDQQVRQHEQAHMTAAGGYARGGAHFTYTMGPDGKQYATGGEVSIDVSPASTPQATVQKMETVKHAALAPANPSSQDRSVYAAAQKEEMAARQEQAKSSRTQVEGKPAAQETGATAGRFIDYRV